jgi:hypothetical protein
MLLGSLTVGVEIEYEPSSDEEELETFIPLDSTETKSSIEKRRLKFEYENHRNIKIIKVILTN